VVVPGLLLTAVLDRIGLEHFSSSAVYSNAIPFLGDLNPAKYSGWNTFWGNVFFLQTILVHTFGINGPLWSLANEFWYYVLFPLLYFSFVEKKFIRKVLFLAAIAVTCFFIGKNIVLYFFAWIIGFAVVLWQEYRGSMSAHWNKILILVSGFAFLFVLFLIRMGYVTGNGKDFILAGIAGVLVYGLINAKEIGSGIQPFVRFLSGISFSLYVIHFPVAAFLSSVIMHNPVNMSAGYFLLYILTLLAIVMVVSVFWYLFESRYVFVRTYVKKSVSARLFNKEASGGS
jgi:peptidoglycan/LPS O-acetylase OafA/YrhL